MPFPALFFKGSCQLRLSASLRCGFCPGVHVLTERFSARRRTLLCTQRRQFSSPPSRSHSARGCTTPPLARHHAELSANDFLDIPPMVLLQTALRQFTLLDGTEHACKVLPAANYIIIPRATFNHFCVISHVRDSAAALAALEEAGVVVSLQGGAYVHLRPVQLAEDHAIALKLSSSGGAPTNFAEVSLPPSFLLEEAERRVRETAAAESAMRRDLLPAIARAARWRRSVWGGALLYAGLQLAVVARLTFFDLGWDTMEPVTYCLALVTSLVFYIYFMRFGNEDSYAECDRRFLPKKVIQFAPANFDWGEYKRRCDELVDATNMLAQLREWAKTH